MKPFIRLASATLAIGVVLATPLAASASTQERFSVAGSGAEAVFSTCPTLPVSGQVCTDTQIGVASQITRADGSKSSDTTLSISILRYSMDSAGAFVFISETAGFGLASLSIDARLTRASATASFQVITCGVDSCDNGTTATIGASWTGQGALLHDVSNQHFTKGPFSVNLHMNGIVRDASASATVNGSDLGASLFAEMFNVKRANVIICHMC
jgi:hypothetical protein